MLSESGSSSRRARTDAESLGGMTDTFGVEEKGAYDIVDTLLRTDVSRFPIKVWPGTGDGANRPPFEPCNSSSIGDSTSVWFIRGVEELLSPRILVAELDRDTVPGVPMSAPYETGC